MPTNAWRTLLLIAQATCNWVEISQQHYRKPARIHATTEVYANQTIANTWTGHRNINTRVEVSSVRKKQRPDIHEEIEKLERDKEFTGTVERVPSVGVIRRVQLLNRPVKSPIIESTNVNKLYSSYEISLVNSAESEELHHNNRKNHVYTTEPPINSAATKITFRNYSFIKHDDEPNHFVHNTRITDDDFNTVRFKGKISKITHDELVTKPTKNTPETLHEKNKLNDGISDYITTEKILANEQIIDENRGQSNVGNKQFVNNDSDDVQINNKDVPTEETPTPNNKAGSMEVLIKVMKTVADTISKHSHRSLQSKLRYLHELKNTLLNNIEYRIDSIWPDDTDSQNVGRRRARSAEDSSRGHMEFPSSESSLMTISFLTFAVFLIKLVLQVIQTYKSKAMIAPIVVATAGRTAVGQLQAKQ